MGVVEDFNALYDLLKREHELSFVWHCQEPPLTNPIKMRDIKTYFCCATNIKKCVMHNCVVVIIGTTLDKLFRRDEENFGFEGTFIVDGRHFSFPNIMMNNNVLLHNFFDKRYARDKNMRRMFLYGNYDNEKFINRAIQLVYDRKDDILYVRDVYAKDYIVDSGINKILRDYLKCSGKWRDMDFVFDFESYDHVFEQLKKIMSVDIDYNIDSLSNKIIYKHSYLLQLTYNLIFNKLKIVDNKKKHTGVLFPVESKKCYDIIVSGKLIQSVSKTLSKQKKYDQDYNSNNNNLETYPLKHRIGNEVLRIINENLQQDMLKHTGDFIKFIDSFFHGEMTVAGKKFFLTHNVTLPDVNYKHISGLFKSLLNDGLIGDAGDILVAFNNRPTKFMCKRQNLYIIYHRLKNNQTAVEIKFTNDILFINHHEGMVMLKQPVQINNTHTVHTLQTAYEYHSANSVVNKSKVLKFIQHDDTTSLMSTMILQYYKGYLQIFNTTPVAKLIVSLTNLKNGMVVQKTDYKFLPIGNSVIVDDDHHYCNDRMFYLWTLVRDNKLKTAEDPYIPHHKLPMQIYHNKVQRIKGKMENGGDGGGGAIVEYKACAKNNVMEVEGCHKLCAFGTMVSNKRINWNYDGRKYKIEYCTSKNWHVYKFYMYFRTVTGQTIKFTNSSVNSVDVNVTVKLELVYSVEDLTGLKICGIHGQKGVLSEAEDLSAFRAHDDRRIHAQICLSPISYLSRQTSFDGLDIRYCVQDNGTKYPLIKIPYMFFNNTPDTIYKEFICKNITGYEKLEGTRLDQWSINQSFMGNRLSEGLHCIRNGNDTNLPSGQFNIFKSLIHCNNINIKI
ncbi:late expression factor 8 [Epinotia aporema granulovirus]|uniref:DNA-directed RNA polymerase n=1 Tax=Epinotia aporema granulovirus TaxID=166056 RepID=K4EQ35_9BBAC|nr:late expression factor 8 [Epinotia aporema granulovirus]AER41547.1 late expression factor 8 [Epinotia aporema granulovirus]